MGIYERWLLPRLLDLVMRNEEATRYRMKTIPAARGRVLEIGAGSGLNLPFYGAGVTRLYALDPSRPLLDMAGRKHPPAGLPVEVLERSAEEIPLESHSIDTVVTTWTLCSIPDASQAVQEMRRGLRRDGQLLFVEHLERLVRVPEGDGKLALRRLQAGVPFVDEHQELKVFGGKFTLR